MRVLLLLIHGRSSYIHPATAAHSWQETTSHLSQGNGGYGKKRKKLKVRRPGWHRSCGGGASSMASGQEDEDGVAHGVGAGG